MSGIHEILLIVALVVGLFYLPRLARQRQRASYRTETTRAAHFRLGWLMRLLIVASVLWPLSAAFFTRVWEGDRMLLFFEVGVLPVLILWGILWVVSGLRNSRRDGGGEAD